MIGLVYASESFVRLETKVPWVGLDFSLINLHSQPPGLAVLTAIFLWVNGGIRNMNFGWPFKRLRYILQLGALLVVLIFAKELFTLLIYHTLGWAPSYTEISKVVKQPQTQYLFILVIFPLWALAEEFFYRAYLIHRIEQLSFPWRYSTLLAVLLSSAVFASNHLQYGPGGLPSYFFSALLFSAVYLYKNRNIWFVAIIHYLNNLGFLLF